MPDDAVPAPPSPAGSGLLDTPAEESFDRLTRLASRLLRAPVSLMTVMDVDRQFFKSQHGLREPFASARETPLSHSFCQYIVASEEPLLVSDARRDPRLRTNAAIDDLGVVSYAGVPLHMPNGSVVGALCVIGHEPREWTTDDLDTLRELAASMETELRLRADLARRREVEQALRESEARFREVVENLNDGIVVTNSEDRIEYVNGALTKLLGYARDDLADQVAHCMLLPPDGAAAARKRLERRARGEADRYRTPLVRKDGSRVETEVYGAPLRDSAGRVKGTLGVVTDLTDRLRTKEVIRRLAAEEVARVEAEIAGQKIARVLDSITDGFFVLDEHNRFASVNREAERLLQRNKADLLGRHVRDLFPGAAQFATDTNLKEAAERDGAFGFERFDPQLRTWFEVRVYPTREGLSGYFRDIGERKRSEEALRESERRFRAIFDGAAIGIAVVDLEGRAVEANPTLREMLGYGGDELRRMTFGAFTHPADLAKDWELFGELMAGQRDAYHMEKRYYRKDGTILWGGLTVSLVRGKDGEPQFAVGMIENITERKVAEEALQESQAQLLQSHKMESVGRLAGGIAHDFNNLLTVITGNAELLRPSLAEGSPELEDLTEIEGAARRAAALTRQLLTFSRQEIADAQPLDLNDVVSRVEKLLRRVIGEDLKLNLHLAVAPAVVKADAGQVEQVLVNLVINARDAMPRGGAITIQTQHVRIDANTAPRPSYLQPGEYVALSVSDTGVGMDAETQIRIFEPFFTTKEIGKGTGLGLATVYGIVRQSGGDVTVQSSPGQGTRFEILLPLLQGAVTDTRPPGASPATAGTGTILLVEDEDAVRTITERILTRAGYRVLAASHAEAALHLAAEHAKDIDLLLTDMVMPGMGGRELVSQIKDLYPEIGCLLMTGYSNDRAGYEATGSDLGIPLLQKPFGPEALLHAIQQCVGGK